ncbi:MAG: coenzyme F420 biosynthesis associated uncharacterized protein [Glaciecola sp.]
MLDERLALRAARLVMPTRTADPEAARALRAAVKADMPAIDAAARTWSELGADLASTHCRVVSRPGWVRANLAGLRGALDPVADKLGQRSKLASKVLGIQLGSLLGLLSTKVLGQFVLPLGSAGGGQLVVVGPNLLELAEEHGPLARDIHRTILLHEVTHRLQFDAVDWLGGHLRSLVASYLQETKVDPQRLTEMGARLPELIGELRRTGSITPIVEALMTERQIEVLDQAQGLMSLLEGHGTAAMYGATAGVVDDPVGVRAALSNRPADATTKILTAVAGLEKKKSQYRLGEAFVSEVVESAGIAGLNQAFLSPSGLPSTDEVAEPGIWLARMGLTAP